MKSKENVKKASEEALENLLRTIQENLNEKEAKELCYELSASCFTFAVDFDQELDEILIEAATNLNKNNHMIIGGIIDYKLNGNGAKHYEINKD